MQNSARVGARGVRVSLLSLIILSSFILRSSLLRRLHPNQVVRLLLGYSFRACRVTEAGIMGNEDVEGLALLR